MNRALAIVVCAVALALARVASADEAGALVVYNEALELMQEKRYEAACPRFEASFRMAPTVRAKLAVGLCHERAGRIATAWAAYREAARLAKQAKDDMARDAAQARAEALEPRMPRLVVVVGRAANVTVRLDGDVRPSTTIEQALPVDPGRHVVRAEAEGRRPFERVVTLAEGERASVEIPALEAAPADAPRADAPAVVPAASSSSTGRTLGFVLLGVGAAGLVTGGVTGFMVIDKGDERAALCVEGCRSERELERARALNDEGEALSAVSTIAFAAGGAFALAGAYFVLTSKSGTKSGSPGAIVPVVAPYAVGMALARSF